jgi:predicted nucleotide-binding protein (sugar kinase/HSP70/actin superfamily)
MKVSYFTLGNLHIAMKGLFQDLGIKTVEPKKITKTMYEYGIKHSPENACYPFKMLLGQYKDACDRGADTIFFMDSHKAFGCRLHQYVEGAKCILKKQGYDVRFIGEGGYFGKDYLFKVSKEVNPSLTKYQYLKALVLWLYKMKAIEELEVLASDVRVFEKKKGESVKLLEEGLEIISQVRNPIQLKKANDKIKKLVNSVEKVKKNSLKILVLGDLYTMLEHEANKNIVPKLNDMGVQVIKPYRFNEELRSNSILKARGKHSFEYKEKLAKPYLKRELGAGAFRAIGDCLKNIENVDGVIQLFGFSCMPEIVNNSILMEICKKYKKPFQSLSIGEHDSDSSYFTKLEAFVDILKERKCI